ncbi:MAG: heparinase II/III family protein [Bacteroidales bacterium]|nr:heparinase II/III family protein [Bacteroidales bacterium]
MIIRRFCATLLCLAALCVLPGCEKENEDRFSKISNTDDEKEPETPSPGTDQPETYTPTEEDLAVDRTLFGMLNWNYEPLKEVKALYDAKKYKQASEALLYHFKTRKDVVNPEVSLPVLSITNAGLQMAYDALKENGYRFCVHAGYFYESFAGGIYKYYSFQNPDGSINWEFVAPDSGTEFYQKHWHYWFYWFAQAYSYTKDEKYFNAWKDQYSDWMEKYPCPSSGKRTYTNKVGDYGYKSWSELSMATRIDRQAQLFEYFIPAAGFDFNWLTKFLTAYSETVEYSLKHLYYAEDSNIRFAQYKSHCLAGCFFPELSKSTEWISAGAKSVGDYFNISVLEDGCLNELDMGYHSGEVENYRLVYNAARANGKLGRFPADYLSKLRKSCEILADYIYPNFQWECFNDTKQQTKSVTQRWMRYFAEMFPDDQKFLWLSTDGAKGTKPEQTLCEYRTSGYYMFYSDWAQKGMMLIYKNNYNPADKWHAHRDNGNIGLCNKGRLFLPGSGSYTYGDGTGGTLDTDRALHQATRNHNTVTKGLADIPKANSKGRYLTSYSRDGVDCVVAENQSYPDLTHRRAVWMVDKSFYVIADAAYGSSSGSTVNLSWHLCRDTGSLGENAVVIDDDSSHMGYGAHTVFTDGNNMVFKSFSDTSAGFKGESGSSWYSEQIGQRQSRKYYRINVTKASASSTPRFITVIHPCSNASSLSIDASFNGAFNASGESLTVTVNGKTYNLSYTLN